MIFKYFFFVVANVNTTVTSSWVINMNSLPQFDSYSTMNKSVNFGNVICRNVTNIAKNILFSSKGSPFNNTSVLKGGQINVLITEVLGYEHTDWNNNCNYVTMICIWEVPTIKLLH